LHRVRQGCVKQLIGEASASDCPVEDGLLGGEGEAQVHVCEQGMEHGDVFVVSPIGPRLASYFAHERLDFNRALVAALGDASRVGFFQGLVVRWQEENPPQ